MAATTGYEEELGESEAEIRDGVRWALQPFRSTELPAVQPFEFRLSEKRPRVPPNEQVRQSLARCAVTFDSPWCEILRLINHRCVQGKAVTPSHAVGHA